MLTNEYRTYRNSAAMLGGTQINAWYIGLFGNAHTPAATDTMTSFLATAGEITDYTGGVRKLLVPDTFVDGLYTNASDNLKFAFPAGATVRGYFITSNPVIGSTTGVLCSTELSTTPKVLGAGEELDVTAGFVESLS